jgi:hypothetical protein
MSQQNQKPGSPRIAAQLSAIMAAVDAVGKTRRNSGQGFNFRGIEDVMDALHPIFAENKVFILSEVTEEKTEERATMKGGTLIYRVLKVRVSFVSGEDGSRESVVVIGEGMDSGDKASNKAMSAALKYALTQTLILPYGQVDGDADSPPDSKPRTEGAPASAAAGNMRSAHDGRALKPGEDPLPPKANSTPTPTPTKQKTTAPDDPAAFHARLYQMMSLAAITEEDLTAYLRKRGLMTAAQSIHNLSPKFVDAMLDGKDKATGRNNFELIAENIRKARAA